MSSDDRRYTVAVRALCDFAARAGDLDMRYGATPSAQDGIEGHRLVTSRRPAGYRREVPLSGSYRQLVVRGRADGYDPARQQLEEIKTYKGDLACMPSNQRALHWAQAKVYGWLLCHELGLHRITIALVYFDVGRQREAPALTLECDASELQAHFEALCQQFIDWAGRELSHRTARDEALSALRFPHAAFRPGQRELAQAVFRGARLGRCLMAQAPTGIGKTIATLFPLLKACPTEHLDKVYYLTAKNAGRALAWQALATLDEPRLRTIELVAREKACEHPDKACHGDSCPLARGFYDRLPAAREAAVARGALTREALREVALAHAICPYHLGQELARWCDVVIGDYNHYFDGNALLHGLMQASGWRVGVLVDEAHNLVERAREMYSASLVSASFRSVRAVAPAALKKTFDRLLRAWNRLAREQTAAYAVLDEPPQKFIAALRDASAAISDHLVDHADAIDSALLQFHFDALQFLKVLETFGAHSLIDIECTTARAHVDSTLCVRNVVPATFLAPRFADTRTTVLFSATLTPWSFYADTLGVPADAAWLDVQPPFRPEQLRVRVASRVSTRWRDRDASLAPIARLIAGEFDAHPGNYLAFFSSFDYLEQVATTFAAFAPHVPHWRQSRRMDDDERAAFLARYTPDGRGVGFAVLGGTFGEAIDLAGTRLIGAFIATLGLPQLNPVNEELRRRLHARFGAGYDYAYLYPGIRKVVQAAGRVIRTPTDRGSVHLIDDRYARRDVQRLLPAWWRIE